MYDTGTTTLLPAPKMKKLGFSEHLTNRWQRQTTVTEAVALTITIDKEDGTYTAEVIDLECGQLYPYQDLNHVPSGKQAKTNVNKEVTHLTANGLTIDVDHEKHRILT